MLYGEKMDPKSSNGTHILKYFKERGFVTGHSENLCSRELFGFMNNCLNNVVFSDFDHENVAMFCDANYFNRDSPYPLLQVANSIIRRCLYGRDTFEYVLEYGEKFWNSYFDNKKFLRLAFMDSHEPTNEIIKYLDEPSTNFLENLFNKKLLEKSAVFFISDHGNGMEPLHSILLSEDFLWVKTMALWCMLFHNNKDEEGEKWLKINEQTLVTPYDVFDTLNEILFDGVNIKIHTRENLGSSVFREIKDAKNRNCTKYTEIDLKEKCRCRLFWNNSNIITKK